MHLLKKCIFQIDVLLYICDSNWIWMLNNNKNTLIYLFIFGDFNFCGKWVYIENKSGISCYLWNGTI